MSYHGGPLDSIRHTINRAKRKEDAKNRGYIFRYSGPKRRNAEAYNEAVEWSKKIKSYLTPEEDLMQHRRRKALLKAGGKLMTRRPVTLPKLNLPEVKDD